MNGKGTTRRGFLQALGGTAAVAGFPTIVPASVFGANAPSNRITTALIGCGGIACGHHVRCLSKLKDVQMVAVCDVWKPAREAMRKRFNLPAGSAYNDFRELIARKDVDTVQIATPDHWHIFQAIAASNAGKDVYCQKPLGNTIGEGRALVNAIVKNKTVFQHGTQLHSLPAVRRAAELVRNGCLGKISRVEIGSPAGHATGAHAPMPVPEGLDWEMFQGPAPRRPYTSVRVFHESGLPGWYFFKDYSIAGWVAGYAVHDLDIALYGLGMPTEGIMTVEGRGAYPESGAFDTILTFDITYTLPSGVRIHLTDLTTGKNRHGTLFVGEKGTVFTRGHGPECNPKSLNAVKIGAAESALPKTEAEAYAFGDANHFRNFFDCVRSRKGTLCGAETAQRVTSLAQLGEMACFLKRKLAWDWKAERFVNDEEANRMLRVPMTAPWQV